MMPSLHEETTMSNESNLVHNPSRLALTALFLFPAAAEAQSMAVTDVAVGKVRFVVAPNAGGGLWAWSVAAADLDQDGDLDYVTADIDEQLGGVPAYASVVLNQGHGTFAAPVPYAVGEAPRCVVLADFSGDGYADIAVSDTWNDRISVLKNKGDGTFFPRVNYSATWTAYDMATSDFNSDGAVDIAVAGEADTVIKILRNNGSGGFSTANTLNLGSTGCTLATGDVDRDGKIDIIAADTSSVGVKVFRNLGSSFAPYVLYPVGNGYHSDVKAADFDNDGWVDIVANGGGPSFWLLRNDGTGHFGTAKDVETSAGWEMEVGDFDGDGWIDLASGNYIPNSVSVLLNDRAGGFRPRVDWGTTDQPRSIATGDFDGDGLLDIVAASADSSARRVTILRNIGKGEFYARRDYPMVSEVNDVVLGDMDNDGELDAVTAVYLPNLNKLGFLWGLGDATFEQPRYTDDWGNMQPTGLASGDLDKDGWLDVAVSVFSPGNGVLVLRNLGNRTFGVPDYYAAGGNPSDVAIGDLDGDTWLDLVVSNGSQNDSSIHVFRNKGNGSFATGVRYDVGYKPNSLAIGDWDRDGDMDVCVTNLSAAITLMYNAGDGVLSRVNHYVGTSQTTPELVDIDGDHWLDIVLTTGWVTLLRNDRRGGFGPPEVSNTPAGGIVLADFDRDGHLDAAGVDGVRSEVCIGLGDGGGDFLAETKQWEIGYHPGRLASGDLNHDGFPELLTANVTGRSVTVLENSTKIRPQLPR
jgi:hypothetical protein